MPTDIETIKKEFEEVTGFDADNFGSLFDLIQTKLNEVREEAVRGFVGFYAQQVIPEQVIEGIDFKPENVEYSCGVADQAFVDHIEQMITNYLTYRKEQE